MKVINQLMIVGLLAAVAAGGYLAYERVSGAPAAKPQRASSARPGERPVVIATARSVELDTHVEAVGTSLARRSVDIVPLATGRVRSIGFRSGDRVAAGQGLVELDDEIERADLAQAEATLTQARLALQRAQMLRQKNHVAEATVEDLTSKARTAEAAVDRAKRKLADRSIRAPFPGVVGINRVHVGARVDDTTVITTLDDLAQIEIEFSIPEQFYGQVAVRQPAAATSASFPGRTFSGQVSMVDSRIDATSRSFKVRVAVPNPDFVLPAGMFMHVQLTLGSREGLTVPEEAIVPEAGATYVFVVDVDKAQRRKVVVGRRELGLAEITKGLSAGEKVVVKGLASLREGVPVRVVGTEEARR